MLSAAKSASYPKFLISPRFSAESSSKPIHLQPSQLPFVTAVKSKLTSEYKLERSPCPCREDSGVVISEVDRYGLPLTFVLCSACGTIRIDPYLDGPSLEDFYTRAYQQMYGRATDVESYILRQESYGKKVIDVAKPALRSGSWVFEVGCGAGGALNVFHRCGYQVAGCDYSGELIAAGRKRGIPNIYQGSVKDIPPPADGAKADLIYMSHVFEHVNHPLELLEECRNLLAPGGRIIIIVPDVSGIDSFTYPAGDLLQFLHIAHKYNFSFEGLRRLGNQAGYQVRTLVPNRRLQTHCSHMPELWVELVNNEDAPRQEKVSGVVPVTNYGDQMLKYLRRTEQLHSLGLCRAQLANKLNESKTFVKANLLRLSRVTPAKVIGKVKGIT